jgi:hypothetical protein
MNQIVLIVLIGFIAAPEGAAYPPPRYQSGEYAK